MLARNRNNLVEGKHGYKQGAGERQCMNPTGTRDEESTRASLREDVGAEQDQE